MLGDAGKSSRSYTELVDNTSKSVLVLLWWWSTRLHHFLHHIEADPGLGLILSDGDHVQHIKVAHVGGVGVTLLVDAPLKLCRVRMSCKWIEKCLWVQVVITTSLHKFVVPSSANTFFSVRAVASRNILPSAVFELRDLGAFKAALKHFVSQELYQYYSWPCKMNYQCTLQPTSSLTCSGI
ncbi:hypothetical protein E2C01_017072 [Portunus trituberculatus]|uniref:Uncharacterized protein n=1 Tax=Portunus trituberculatus TaxID=210409 RepID=A0A5B7DQN5_PORTR|nr:hypothetical protein [Portunus trituberculatus]